MLEHSEFLKVLYENIKEKSTAFDNGDENEFYEIIEDQMSFLINNK